MKGDAILTPSQVGQYLKTVRQRPAAVRAGRRPGKGCV